jgi:hypothetical protein
MQWSCPHCGVNLAVSDDTLGSGWSFSKCYKCGGFALVRKAEINIIKVDKAPPGERVILPEGSADPSTGLLNKKATQRLAQHVSKKPNSLPHAPLSQSKTPPLPPAFQKTGGLDISSSYLPEPLPELPSGTFHGKTIPIGITVASILAIGSGIYLYIQGQALWKKARESALNNTRDTSMKVSLSTPAKKEVVPAPSLLDEEPLPQERPVAAQKQAPHLMITDQVQKSAMSPLKPESTETTMVVKLKAPKANFHSGPGTQYPAVGTVQPETSYQIADWNDRWFKLMKRSGITSTDAGWVRNDLVQVISNHSNK